MSIQTEVCTSGAARAVRAMLQDAYKVALLKPNTERAFGADTANYSEIGADEVKGAGYQKGGMTLAGARLVMRDGRACLDFDPAIWPGGDIVASGAVIYCAEDGCAMCTLDFGGIYGAAVGEIFMLPFDCPIRL